jgi:hypothetical protein
VRLRTPERILECSGNLGHGDIPLLPSLDVCPGGEGDSSTPCLGLLASMQSPRARVAVAALTATHTTSPRQAATRAAIMWKVEFDTS